MKILFADPHGQLPLPIQDGDKLIWPRPLPVSREYTVRRYDIDAGELDIDFVVHEGGLASAWATAVQPGDRIWIAGPPRGTVVPDVYDFYVLVGDETALPAIARFANELPATAAGRIGVIVHDPEEGQELIVPAGVEVTWLYRDADALGLVVNFLSAVKPPAGARTYLWVAGEQRLLKAARDWAQTHGVRRHDRHTTGYWR